MDLAFQFLSDIVLYIIGLYFPQQTHAHLGIVSAFTQSHSFLLDLFLYSSPVAYWAPINLGSSTLSVISFCLFILFMDFSRQECWGGLPIPSPVDHVLSEFSTMTRPSWVTLHSMPHSFTELDKAVVSVIKLASCLWLWFQSVSPLMPSLSAYQLTWVSVTLDVGYLFKSAPAKRSHCSLSWTWGSSFLRKPSSVISAKK